MFAFITHMRARPGKRDTVIALTRKMQEQTAGEEGVPIYVFHTAADAPDEFYFYDLYESQAVSDAHNATPQFAATMGPLMEIAEVVSVTKLVPYGPIKSEGLSVPAPEAP